MSIPLKMPVSAKIDRYKRGCTKEVTCNMKQSQLCIQCKLMRCHAMPYLAIVYALMHVQYTYFQE